MSCLFVPTELPKMVREAVAQAMEARRTSISSTPSRPRATASLTSPSVAPTAVTPVTPAAAGATTATSSRKSLLVTPTTPVQETRDVVAKKVSLLYGLFWVLHHFVRHISLSRRLLTCDDTLLYELTSCAKSHRLMSDGSYEPSTYER
jgi:hypothetical protein